jgi:hypothetical protein
MSQRSGVKPAYWLSIAFSIGVPFGIALGAIAAAVFDLLQLPHRAAWGLLLGVASAVLIGSVSATVTTRRNYRWTSSEFEVASDAEWLAVVRALNVTAAAEHYLIVRQEADYVAYVPTLLRPVAAGPLTVSAEYLSVIVARSNATRVTMAGPWRLVKALKPAALHAGAVGLSEQDAHAGS